jgi:hypothetical protein
MKSDTNNLLERFFRSVKRDYLRGMRAKRSAEKGPADSNADKQSH